MILVITNAFFPEITFLCNLRSSLSEISFSRCLAQTVFQSLRNIANNALANNEPSGYQHLENP